MLTKEGAEEAPAGKRREEPQPLEKPKYDISNVIIVFEVMSIFI